MTKPRQRRRAGRSSALGRVAGGNKPAGAKAGAPAEPFNQMLDQYNKLQQQTMVENMEMQKAQAFWNPIESLSKKDATS